ncbi:hypothetical protein BGZ83_000360, partial [Gryganskiella cystojenkinii]
SFACPSFDVDEIFGDVSGPDIDDGFNSNTFYSNHWACVDSLRNLTIGQFAWSSHVGRSERAKERLGSLKFLEDLTLGKVVIRAGEIASWRWPQGQFSRLQLQQDPNLRSVIEIWPRLKNYTFYNNNLLK